MIKFNFEEYRFSLNFRIGSDGDFGWGGDNDLLDIERHLLFRSYYEASIFLIKELTLLYETINTTKNLHISRIKNDIHIIINDLERMKDKEAEEFFADEEWGNQSLEITLLKCNVVRRNDALEIVVEQ